MEQHYRQHVVVYDTSYDDKSKQWMAAAHVRFSEGVKVRIVSVPVPAHFKTQEDAQEGAILSAREWIDGRLRLASGPFSRNKKKIIDVNA